MSCIRMNHHPGSHGGVHSMCIEAACSFTDDRGVKAFSSNGIVSAS